MARGFWVSPKGRSEAPLHPVPGSSQWITRPLATSQDLFRLTVVSAKFLFADYPGGVLSALARTHPSGG
jgi:hypothetical protein